MRRISPKEGAHDVRPFAECTRTYIQRTPEQPRGPEGQDAQKARRRGCVSLVTFLCTSKESNPLARRASGSLCSSKNEERKEEAGFWLDSRHPGDRPPGQLRCSRAPARAVAGMTRQRQTAQRRCVEPRPLQVRMPASPGSPGSGRSRRGFPSSLRQRRPSRRPVPTCLFPGPCSARRNGRYGRANAARRRRCR